MKTPLLFPSVIVIALALLIAGPGAAHARTPTPTPTDTPEPQPLSPPSPTPRLPRQGVAHFRGSVWADGRLQTLPVTARIGEVECGEPVIMPLVAPSCGPGPCGPSWEIDVVSDEMKAGCGFEGATITFFAGDRKAQTAIWHADTTQGLALIVGPPFAYVKGWFSWNGNLPYIHYANPEETTGVPVPYVGDVACGYAILGVYSLERERYSYFAIVYSQEQRAGCGVEGASITYKLLGASGNVIAVAAEKGVWHAWDGVADNMQQLDLAMVPVGGIRLGSMGTGGPQGGGNRPTAIVLALALAGLTALGAGAALRKRASP